MADEVWVIVKPETPAEAATEDTPGCGAMLATVEGQDKDVPLPLRHTAVTAEVIGHISTVHVVQQFHNPFDTEIEAVYVFPLPHNAAVNDFLMTIGKRTVRGIIRERKEAEQIYQQARSQGYVASLLTQERPNIFTQKVANIEPGKQIDVDIKYFNTLDFVDGWHEFVFPMVVGPRFNPPGSTDGIGAVAQGKAGISGQKTEVQYLRPDTRSGHDISLALDVDAGVAIEAVQCSSHVIARTSDSPHRMHVQLSPHDTIPNKDFVLRFKVAGERIKSGLVTHQDQGGGYFSLMVYPPDGLTGLERSPMEMIFVLDCSGSMRGEPIAKSKQAVKRALRMLGLDDTFQVINFSNTARQWGPVPVTATRENIEKAVAYVDSLQGEGGTMMIKGIAAALDFPHDERRFRLVSFMTDGYIGNEAEILSAIHARLGASRIFSFGIGSAVNRYLLDGMACMGKGAVAYVGLNDDPTVAVDRFYERISHPALTDVTIDFGTLKVSDVVPSQIPDLFVGRPIMVTGRFVGQGPTRITLSGHVLGERQQVVIPVPEASGTASHPGIAAVWARKQVEVLGDQLLSSADADLAGRIKDTALAYNLMSAYTAFVAVDSSQRTGGDHGVSVVVPVPVPDGVRYDTTVQE
ncbi:MAG: VWA domain-containing protein [Phycisphaerae bacterium]|nr:VWA domain-containing protein [Phycisphaerae bacterium]